MADLTLVDTSAWIAFFRGEEPVASLVDQVLADGSAALCGVVELELRRGIRAGERETVIPLLMSTHRLPTTETDWASAGDLLASLRRTGVTIPSTDGLIAHLALRHEAVLLERDEHFRGIPGLTRVRDAPE